MFPFCFVVPVAMILLSLGVSAATTMAWQSGQGYRSSEVQPQGTKPGFTFMAGTVTGVLFTNSLKGDAFLTNAVAHNGSGVALGDVDGDGWTDIYLCNLQGPNALYRNLGEWRFEAMEIGPAACAEQFSTGAAFADVDGDGDLDLLVNGIAVGTRLFLNDGQGHFTESVNSGLSRTASATSLALADIDGDGDLDLYCTHYIDEMHLADPTTKYDLTRSRDGQWIMGKVNGELATSPRLTNRFQILPNGRLRELPEFHGFYRNDGKGQFMPIIFEKGVFQNEKGEPIEPYRDWGLAVMFRDLNGDGAPDFYVCNDNASPDRVWINTGKGQFRAIDPLALRHTSRSSMGIDIADVNRDGFDDMFVADMLARDHSKRLQQLVKDLPDPELREQPSEQPRYNRNALFWGRADGTFSEVAFMAGLAASDWSWCPIFLDIDLDGYEDLIVTTGFNFDVMDQDSHDRIREMRPRLSAAQATWQLKRSRQFHPRWSTPKSVFRNRGDGTFEPTSQWGLSEANVSNGAALGDLDNDGDLDLVVNNMNEAAGLYRNDSTQNRIAVRLRGKSPNTQGIGARIELIGGKVSQSQEMIAGGRYLSGDQPMRVFAARSDNQPIQLEVKWRNGSRSVITNVTPNHIYEVDEKSAAASQRINAVPHKPLFTDASSMLAHIHHESVFDDWARQPLLPKRLSRLGPAISSFDFDGDGWEDLIITSGAGGKLSLFRNEQGKGFQPLKVGLQASGDQTAILGVSGSGGRRLLAALSNYELPPGAQSELWVLNSTNLAQPQTFPAGLASIGPMALGDVDGDGDLDLFVGGRVLPGKYPQAASSTVWLSEGGSFHLDAGRSEPFKDIGLVSGATFTDLDGDGLPDLALAMEWGPVRVFRSLKTGFEDVTARWGLETIVGWWTSIATGDFDGDGRLDLVVGNWGRNSPYELYQSPSIGLFFNDWNDNGTFGLVEAWRDGSNWMPLRDRNRLAQVFPDLRTRFTTHQAFAQATIADLLGPRYRTAQKVEATHLESAVFLNRGSNFVYRALPSEAQISPIMGLTVGDFDADGVEDLFAAQNFYGTLSDVSREDSGRGLLLRGRGDGSFEAVDSSISGIAIEGEQRGVTAADFDHDRRLDLAVTQNSGQTRLFMNNSAKSGIRVVFRGPASNPDGIGAELKILYGDGWAGPARFVGGSQKGSAQLLGFAERPLGVWIRWPGGKERTVRLDGRTEFVLPFDD